MTATQSDWILARASVRGKSHIDGDIVNQDAMYVVRHPGNNCFAVAISDGAGTADRADEGSQHFSREIGNGLYNLVTAVDRKAIAGNSQNVVADYIHQLIVNARKSLDPSQQNLRQFHCNLMALAIGPKWGIMVFLGDAVMLKSSFKAGCDEVEFFVNPAMTAQDRTEYANETHFITETDWPKHLGWEIVDPNGPEDMFALMTDGAADIAMSPVPGSVDKRVNKEFFAPLLSMVLAAPDEAERDMVVDSALGNRQTYRLTGDDKTMLLVIRRPKLALGELEPIVKMQAQTAGTAVLPKPITPATTATPQQLASPPSPPKLEPTEPVAAATNQKPNEAANASAHQSLPPLPATTGHGDKLFKRRYMMLGALFAGSLLFGLVMLGALAFYVNKHVLGGQQTKAETKAKSTEGGEVSAEKIVRPPLDTKVVPEAKTDIAPVALPPSSPASSSVTVKESSNQSATPTVAAKPKLAGSIPRKVNKTTPASAPSASASDLPSQPAEQQSP